MRLRATLLSGLLAGALPLAGRAQTTELAPLPRYYAGLGIYRFPAIEGNAFATPTFGWQFRPRWALQASVAFRSQRYDYDDSYTYYDYSSAGPNTGQYHDVSYSGTIRTRSLAVPVLVRYTLTRRQQHRFQADLLGGVTWLRQAHHSEQLTVDRTLGTTNAGGYDSAQGDLFLTAGPSLRLRIWRGLEATGELTYNVLATDLSSRFGDRFFGNVSAGLRYRFGD